jgi:hypothetical protein
MDKRFMLSFIDSAIRYLEDPEKHKAEYGAMAQAFDEINQGEMPTSFPGKDRPNSYLFERQMLDNIDETRALEKNVAVFRSAIMARKPGKRP